MLDLQQQHIFKRHAMMRGIIESVYAFDTLTKQKIYAHLGILQYIKKHYSAENVDTIADLCTEVQERLAWISKAPTRLLAKDRQELIAYCDELRLRIVVSALNATSVKGNNGKENTTLSADSSVSELQKLCSPVTQENGNLTYASVARTRVFVLPKLRSERQCSDLYEELVTILENLTATESWVMDFSMMGNVPASLLANLIIYAQKLRIAGDDIHLCWVEASYFSKRQLPRVVSFFDLTKAHGYYFSAS